MTAYCKVLPYFILYNLCILYIFYIFLGDFQWIFLVQKMRKLPHYRCFVSNTLSVKRLVQLSSNGDTFSRLWFECSVWQQQNAFHVKNTTFSSLEGVNMKDCPVRFSRRAFVAVLYKAPFVIIQQYKLVLLLF